MVGHPGLKTMYFHLVWFAETEFLSISRVLPGQFFRRVSPPSVRLTDLFRAFQVSCYSVVSNGHEVSRS
jgi:hypothetical protein